MINDQSAHDTAGGPATPTRPGLWRRSASGRVFAVVGLLVSGLAGTSAVLLANAQTAGAVTPSPTCTSATCTVTLSETGAPVLGMCQTGPAHFASPSTAPTAAWPTAAARGSGAEVQATVSANNATPLIVNVGGTAALQLGRLQRRRQRRNRFRRRRRRYRTIRGRHIGVGSRWRRWRRINSPKQRW